MTFTVDARNMTAKQANVIKDAINRYMAGVEITYNSVTDLYEVCNGNHGYCNIHDEDRGHSHNPRCLGDESCKNRHWDCDVFVPRLDADGMFQLTIETPNGDQWFFDGEHGSFLRMVLRSANENRTTLALSYATGKDRELMELFDAMWFLFNDLAENARLFGLGMRNCPVPFYDNTLFDETSETPRKNVPCTSYESELIDIFLREGSFNKLIKGKGEDWYFCKEDQFYDDPIDYNHVPDCIERVLPGDLPVLTVDKGDSWHAVHEEIFQKALAKATEMPLDGLAGLFA